MTISWSTSIPRLPCAVFAMLVATSTTGVYAQDEVPVGLEVSGLPALNFDADEGYGYGVLAEIYQYGQRRLPPYEWTLQPTLFFTTEGRSDVTLFFDGPHVLPNGWRLTAFGGSQQQIANPYYGVGNTTVYDEALDDEEGPDPFYYRFGRLTRSATFTLQRGIPRTPVRFLFGGGIVRTTVDPFPKDEGTTLYAQHFGTEEETEWTNYVRGGLIWDTRDRETGPRRGSWTELLVQWVDEGLGSTLNYATWTFTDRRYFSLTDRLVFAHRYLLQGASSGAPAYELSRIQSSFRQQEGLGGAKTLRGVLRNRFVGRGMLVWNAELRWRVVDFEMRGRSFHLALSSFLDQGRVWDDGVKLNEALTDLHRGFGGGVRVGMGENFVAALDAGRSKETGVQIYIGLGYLY